MFRLFVTGKFKIILDVTFTSEKRRGRGCFYPHVRALRHGGGFHTRKRRALIPCRTPIEGK